MIKQFDFWSPAGVLADKILFSTFIGRRGKKLKLFKKLIATLSAALLK